MPWLAAAVMGLALMSTPANQEVASAGASTGQETTRLDDVVVQGQRLDDQVRGFIDEVIAPPSGWGPARWRTGVCVGVVNIRGEAAQYVVDRVSEVAREIGLRAGGPGCRPSILIIGAADGAGMARGLVEARPWAFWPGASGTSRSRVALEAFQAGDAAVRWWHVSVPVDDVFGRIAVRLPGGDVPVIAKNSGRLGTPIRNNLSRAIIIVDMDKADGFNLRQIADYAAMVAFSQVDPDADTRGYDSVLSLFSQPTATAGLTDWDMAYMKALYSAELNQARVTHQAGEIQGLMARDRKRAQEVVLPTD